MTPYPCFCTQVRTVNIIITTVLLRGRLGRGKYRRKTSLTERSDSPTYLLSSSGPLTEIKLKPAIVGGGKD